MGERWNTSWYWGYRRIPGDPPSDPPRVSAARAEQLGLLIELALSVGEETGGARILALSHERLSNVDDLADMARIEYRVTPSVRFPSAEAANGPARRAWNHVRRLQATGQLGATRGPFHLSEVHAQGGVAMITARADVIEGGTAPRLGVYVPVAVTRDGGPLEPMQVMLYDPASDRVLRASDDVLTRAWHGPLAGGEMLTIFPAVALPDRAKSGTLRAVVEPDVRGSVPPGRDERGM